MIEKRTVIDQIEVTRDGHIQLRLGLLIIEDGVEVVCQWHRTSIEPGGDIDATIAAVNTDITTRDTLKAKAIEAEKVPLLKSICKVVHTPEVVKKYRSDTIARQKAQAAQEAKKSEAEIAEEGSG